MSEHTPGPWIARRMSCQSDSHTYNSEVITADGTEVATILKEPDARLIAAAPQLLEALESLTDSFECCIADNKPQEEWDEYDHMMLPRWQAARATIRKARGE